MKQFVKRITTLFVIILVFGFTFGITLPKIFVADAVAPPNIVTYQGRILNANGVPDASASLSMIFRLYDSPAAGTCLWSNSSTTCASATSRSVTLTNGLFSENLGDTTLGSPYAAIADTVFANNAAVYLDVNVAGESMTPRKRITAAPYALNAQTVDGLNSTDFDLDRIYDNDTNKILNVDTNDLEFSLDGAGLDLLVDLNSTGDFSIQKTGTPFFVVNDDQTFDYAPSSTSGLMFQVDASSLTSGSVFSATSGSGTLTSADISDIHHIATYTSIPGNVTGEVQKVIRYINLNDPGVGNLNVSGAVFRVSNHIIRTSGTVADTAITLQVDQNDSLGTGDAVSITNLGLGDGLQVSQQGDANAIIVSSTAGTQDGIEIFFNNAASTGNALQVQNSGLRSGINISQLGDTPSTSPSSTASAALSINNDANNGIGLSMYTNNGATANAPLAYLFSDNTAFDEEVLTVWQEGVEDAVLITQTGTDGIGLHIVQDSTANEDGTTASHEGLVIDVNDAASSNEVMKIRSDADGTPDTEFRFENDGDAFADGAWTGGGADYAEYFYTNDTFSNGQTVCRDSVSETVKKCAAGENDVMGVVSTNAAFVANSGGAEATHATDPNYVLVGMLGQIETSVTAADGAIGVGDPITASASAAGSAGLATRPGQIIGYALESLAAGAGTITVEVRPQWYAGNVLSSQSASTTQIDDSVLINKTGFATASVTGFDSEYLSFRGSGWDGASAQNVEMIVQNDVTDSSNFKLKINNGVSDVAFFNNQGDLAISGRLYPSDSGTMQTSKYIYYEGSGDYMRTNAAGWATGSYDFAEMFPSLQPLASGEVVVFAAGKEQVERSTGITYDDKIAGVVSTRPGFLAGNSATDNVPIALAGRVPTYVSGENGDIAPGDPLTTSSKLGYAMKATEAGPILGYAMESFSGVTGSIIAFINVSYYSGDGKMTVEPENIVSQVPASVSALDLSGTININGGNIISVMAINNANSLWRIEEDGDIVTVGRLIHNVKSYQNENVETYATYSRQTTIELSGTAELVNGFARVDFEQVDPAFNDIVSSTAAYRVFLTANSPTGVLSAIDRSTTGFTISETSGTSNSSVDWLVIAYQKDFEPVVATEAVPPVEEVAPEIITEIPIEPIVEEPEVPVIPEVPVVDPEVPAGIPVEVIEPTIETPVLTPETSETPESTPTPEAPVTP